MCTVSSQNQSYTVSKWTLCLSLSTLVPITNSGQTEVSRPLPLFSSLRAILASSASSSATATDMVQAS